MPGLERTGFTLLLVDLSIICLSFNSLSSEVILFSSLTMWLIYLPAGMSSFKNLELSLRISSIALIQEFLSKITTVLPLSAFWITVPLFFNRRLKALLNSEDVRFSGGSQSLEKFWYEVSAVSSSLALITDISSLHKSSRFMSRNNNSKGNKNSEYSINPGLTEKLRALHKMFFSSSVNLYKEKLKITLSGLRLLLKMLFEEIFRRFYNFRLYILSWCKMGLSLATRNKEQI